jgi:hypothetical protein
MPVILLYSCWQPGLKSSFWCAGRGRRPCGPGIAPPRRAARPFAVTGRADNPYEAASPFQTGGAVPPLERSIGGEYRRPRCARSRRYRRSTSINAWAANWNRALTPTRSRTLSRYGPVRRCADSVSFTANPAESWGTFSFLSCGNPELHGLRPLDSVCTRLQHCSIRD